MKITRSDKELTMCFKELEFHTPFIYNGELYLKLNNNSVHNALIFGNSKDFNKPRIFTMYYKSPIEPVNIEEIIIS